MSPSENDLENESKAGSPFIGEPEFLLIGKLRRPHGVHGEMLMDIHTEFPERLQAGVLIYAGSDHQELKIRSIRPNDNTLLVAFESIDTPEAAGLFRNQLMFVHSADRPSLPEGEYYHHQLIGLKILEEDGRFVGTLEEILDLPANDVYVVRLANGAELLLPAIESVIQTIDLDKKEIWVRLLPGLLQDHP